MKDTLQTKQLSHRALQADASLASLKDIPAQIG